MTTVTSGSDAATTSTATAAAPTATTSTAVDGKPGTENDRIGRRTPPADAVNALSADIETISSRIRQALECPVCHVLTIKMVCFCINGHELCVDCMTQINQTIYRSTCPMCRSNMTYGPNACPTTVKLSEVIDVVRVACKYRSNGCTELPTVHEVTVHEAGCTYARNVQCLVSVCQWTGVYDDLYDHVRLSHPKYVTVDSTSCSMTVDHLYTILANRRLTHLVRTPTGMVWVELSRESRSRIMIGVYAVEKPLTAGTRSRGPTNMMFRVSWTGFGGGHKTRRVAWSSAIEQGSRSRQVNGARAPCMMVWAKIGKIDISWYPQQRHRQRQLVVPPGPTHSRVVADGM